MGLMANIKAQKAIARQGKGDIEGARKLYEEAMEKGLDDARAMLAYAVLLIRSGEYDKAKQILVKTQKAPGISVEQKSQLFMDYAVCCYKQGDIDRGIGLMEKQHLHHPSGLIYGSLGYLYAEKYDRKNKPSADEQPAAAPSAEADDKAAEEATGEATAEAPAISPLEAWQAGVDKALAFCKEAVEYDEEDPICLDNLAQIYYRVLGDTAEAKQWFEKAIAIKPGQIDTLWFLSRYDLEAGDKVAAVTKLEKAAEGRFSPLNYATKEQVEAEISRLKAEIAQTKV